MNNSAIKPIIDRVTDKEPLFSALVYGLKPVEDNDNCPTLGTDGEYLFYNTDYLKTLNEEEQSAVVLHEILHCAFTHMWRREARDQMKWNIATDYAINTIVNDTFRLPKGALLDMKYYGMSAEEIYDKLPKMKHPQQSWCDKTGWSNQKGNGKGKQQPNPKDKNGDGKDDTVLEKIGQALKPKKARPQPTMTEQEKEQKWKRLFEEAFTKNFGKLPGSLKRIIENNFYIPVIDWSSLVTCLLSEDVTDYSFSLPDRRYLDQDFVLPDLYTIDKLKDVVFAYDTSGSISSSDLQSFYQETLNLFDNFSNLDGWIAVCDAYLHNWGELNSGMRFEDFRFYGGGGTDFNPVFDKIQELGMRPKALFYFTDTYGSFPREKPDFPVFWLVRSEVGDNERLDVPFGQVIKFLRKE